MNRNLSGRNLAKLVKLIVLSIIATLVVLPASSPAENLGSRGPVFKIVEEGLIAMLKRRLAKIDIEKHQHELQALVQRQIAEPESKLHLPRTKQGRVFYYDPTYILEQDIILPGGKLIYAAGTRVNPLEQMQLERRLYFINANDREQVTWLWEKLLAGRADKVMLVNGADKDSTQQPVNKLSKKLENRIILVEGSVLRLAKELKEHISLVEVTALKQQNKQLEQLAEQIYFDQQAELTNKFSISQLPAVAEQEGTKIKIEEIVIN